MKRTGLSNEPAVDVFGERTIRESYPLEEKKMIVKATISYILWMGDQYRSAAVSIDHCCQESIDKFGEFSPQRTDVPRGQDPANFCKMIYQGKPVDKCPFCGAEIEIKVK